MNREALLPFARDPIAVSTLQPDLSAFHTPHGYVPYVRQGDTTLTLGAPICSPAAMPELARQFVGQFPDATFFYVTDEQRHHMSLPDHRAWPAGADFVIPLPIETWPKEVAAASRKARRAGFAVREVPASELPVLEERMREAQRAYLARREVATEMRFLTRPCLFSAERLGRTFALEVGSAFLGFAVLDPYFTQDGRWGHLLNLFRIGPTKLWGIYQATVAALADQLCAEGGAELSLGFVPLASTPASMPWWLRAQLSALRWNAHRSPYLRGLGRIKRVFAARQVPRYFLSRRRFIARDVVAVLNAMGIRTPLARRGMA